MRTLLSAEALRPGYYLSTYHAQPGRPILHASRTRCDSDGSSMPAALLAGTCVAQLADRHYRSLVQDRYVRVWSRGPRIQCACDPTDAARPLVPRRTAEEWLGRHSRKQERCRDLLSGRDRRPADVDRQYTALRAAP